MPDGSDSLEDSIVSQFLDNLESSNDVSEQVSSVISDFSEEDDFGGHDKIQEKSSTLRNTWTDSTPSGSPVVTRKFGKVCGRD